MRIGPAKTPDTIGHLPKFLKSIDCEGNEWALTDCVGDQLTTNYTCKSNKLAGVKCTGKQSGPKYHHRSFIEIDGPNQILMNFDAILEVKRSFH